MANRLRREKSVITSILPDRLRSAGPRDISDELERGRIVQFPECPFPLPCEEDLRFLREEMPRHLKQKNISYHLEVDRLYGMKADGGTRDRTRAILQAHNSQVRGFLERILPEFAKGWKVGTSSFRPLQEKGREIRRHASSELLHVDAKAYGATHGDRILRFFVNVNPTEERVWISKGTFPILYQKHAKDAGIAGADVREGLLDRALSGFLRGVAAMGLRSARMIDTSPYDRTMQKFHDWMKDTPEFQEDPDGVVRFVFPPFSAWMVFTDMVSHACVSGRHAFIDTFIVPLRNCRFPDHAPFHILQGGARRG
jgi:hypothetical protein